MTFGLDLGSRSHKNVAQYRLRNVINTPAKFEVNTPSGLGGYAFTRNVTEGHALTHARTGPCVCLYFVMYYFVSF